MRWKLFKDEKPKNNSRIVILDEENTIDHGIYFVENTPYEESDHSFEELCHSRVGNGIAWIYESELLSTFERK